MNILKSVLAVCGIALIPTLSSAQEIRLYGGYNGSNVAKAGTEKWVGRAGYQFGADFIIGSRWFLKPGVEFMVRNLNYSLAGTAPDGTTIMPDTEFDYTSRSIRVPVMLGVHLMDPADEPVVNAYLMGGPSALMNLNAKLNNDALTVKTNATQWYIGFGGGLEFGFLFVEAGYDIAMNNVFKGDDFTTNPKVNFIHANAGVRLKLAQ